MPRIGIDSAGNLTAVWIDARTSPARIRSARKPSGGSWSASVEISPSPANAQSLALSVRADGYAWAVWGDTRAGASNQDIWGSRYDPYLATWSTPLRLDDDPGTTANQLNPTVAFTAAEIMLSWRDNRLSANGDTQARRAVFVPGLTDHFALTYDGLNRLKSITGPVSETFTLDGASNITSRTGPSQTDTYDNANRLTNDGTSSYIWSSADRLTNRAADTFGYDPLDRMTSSTVAGSARTYAYNGGGLLQNRSQGTTTTLLWDPNTEPARLLKQGGDNIVYGLGPLYVVKADATTTAFARDGSKNVRAQVTSIGEPSGAFRYLQYGALTQSSGAAPAYLGFATQLVDPSGLLYMRARWYDPATGRFLTRDLASADPASPLGLNAFGYASANPVLLADPSGLCTDPGGSGSRYCIDAFIAKGVTNFGFQTDDRVGPQSNGGTYRFELSIKRDASGNVQSEARPGTSVFDWGPIHAEAPAEMVACDATGNATTIVGGCIGADGLGGGLAPKVGFVLVISESGDEASVVRGQYTTFPSLEVWRYSDTSDPALLLYNDASQSTVLGFRWRQQGTPGGGGRIW